MVARSKAKESREERLARIREKLASTDVGGGRGWWSPPEGKSVIRILPQVKDMEWFFQEVGRHKMTPDGKKSVYCPRFTSDGALECPVCEIVHELYSIGNKTMASSLNVEKKYWMNIVVRKKEGDAGPFIFTPGVKIFRDVMSHIQDPDYGEVYDEIYGRDMILERSGTGRDNTVYQVRFRPAESRLSKDEDQVAKWLDEAKDLSYVVVSDNPEEDKTLAKGHAVFVLPYDRIVREFDLEQFLYDEEEEDEEEDLGFDDDDKFVADDEEFEEEEEEEEEPVAAPVKAASPARAAVEERRAARRRRQG